MRIAIAAPGLRPRCDLIDDASALGGVLLFREDAFISKGRESCELQTQSGEFLRRHAVISFQASQ
jgi:hypothetical protein